MGGKRIKRESRSTKSNHVPFLVSTVRWGMINKRWELPIFSFSKTTILAGSQIEYTEAHPRSALRLESEKRGGDTKVIYPGFLIAYLPLLSHRSTAT